MAPIERHSFENTNHLPVHSEQNLVHDDDQSQNERMIFVASDRDSVAASNGQKLLFDRCNASSTFGQREGMREKVDSIKLVLPKDGVDRELLVGQGEFLLDVRQRTFRVAADCRHNVEVGK